MMLKDKEEINKEKDHFFGEALRRIEKNTGGKVLTNSSVSLSGAPETGERVEKE